MTFTARWGGKCAICGVLFRKGEQIAMPSGYLRPCFAHALCDAQLRDQRESAKRIAQ